MKNFIKENKVLVIVTLAILLLCSVLIVVTSFLNKDEEYVQKDIKNYDLLLVENHNTPIMNDFIYSQLGNNSNINISEYSIFYFLALNKKDLSSENGTLFIEKYSPFDFVPHTGSGIASVSIKGQKWHSVINTINSIDKDRVFEEGEFLFVIVLESSEDLSNGFMSNSDKEVWCGIELSDLSYSESWASKNPNYGYDTEWLRKAPYNEYLKGLNIQIEDKFFDDYRLWQVFELDAVDGSGNKRLVKVINSDKFETCNGVKWIMNRERMNLQMQEEGYQPIP